MIAAFRQCVELAGDEYKEEYNVEWINPFMGKRLIAGFDHGPSCGVDRRGRNLVQSVRQTLQHCVCLS